MKKVCIYLPWSACAVIKTMELDDGAALEAVKPSKKLLAYGDSITQGYDAQHPSNKYITKLAEVLDAQEFNKAIGGEEFFPQLAQEETLEDPDYITVAYGTNDWSHNTREVLIQRCTDMYTILSRKYPKAQIYAITPIWRADWEEKKPAGPFHDVEAIIREAVKDLPNVKVIRGFDLMPENIHLCADLRLHPNDAGFAYYFESLWHRMEEV
jgi:lysophospholipase L1-like esterase